MTGQHKKIFAIAMEATTNIFASAPANNFVINLIQDDLS